MERKGAFLGIWTENKDLYHILLLNRWDGRIGFAGGLIGDTDANETPENTIVRECKEEIGYDVKEKNIKVEYKNVYNKQNGKLTLYFADLKISYEEFMNVLTNIHKAEHFLYEVNGYVVFTISKKDIKNYKEHKVYKNFIKNNLATDVENELNFLLDKIKKTI